MKVFAALCLGLLCPSVLLAQAGAENNAPPDILILEHVRSIDHQRYLPLDWETLTENASSSSRAPSTADGNYAGWPSTEGAQKRMKTRTLFVYTIKIKNVGAKKIAGVVWDYVFTGSGNEKEFTRFQFRNRAQATAGGSRVIIGRSLQRPQFPKLANIEEMKKEGDSPYREHVEIKCVLYADKTWWRQPGVMKSECESLAISRKRKQK